ncbi:DUF6961 family protein [Arenibaculum pallidiluteum]|uniref:DUF6961 family protein n=1 Tax=Arenibaculum pallidiluteum TaxID=2812559 RepID=UPI001A9709A7|nr:hypothetical protein [Arenibaculum pallidiluteum]
MIEADIYRAANLLIQQHGDEAAIHAAMRADELREQGDEAGYATWKRIVTAIDALQAQSIPPGSSRQ